VPSESIANPLAASTKRRDSANSSTPAPSASSKSSAPLRRSSASSPSAGSTHAPASTSHSARCSACHARWRDRQAVETGRLARVGARPRCPRPPDRAAGGDLPGECAGLPAVRAAGREVLRLAFWLHAVVDAHRGRPQGPVGNPSCHTKDPKPPQPRLRPTIPPPGDTRSSLRTASQPPRTGGSTPLLCILLLLIFPLLTGAGSRHSLSSSPY